jgi:hypothetical protein
MIIPLLVCFNNQGILSRFGRLVLGAQATSAKSHSLFFPIFNQRYFVNIWHKTSVGSAL